MKMPENCFMALLHVSSKEGPHSSPKGHNSQIVNNALTTLKTLPRQNHWDRFTREDKSQMDEAH